MFAPANVFVKNINVVSEEKKKNSLRGLKHENQFSNSNEMKHFKNIWSGTTTICNYIKGWYTSLWKADLAYTARKRSVSRKCSQRKRTTSAGRILREPQDIHKAFIPIVGNAVLNYQNGAT